MAGTATPSDPPPAAPAAAAAAPAVHAPAAARPPGRDNLLYRLVRRLTGITQSSVPSFYDRERFDAQVFNAATSAPESARGGPRPIDEFLLLRTQTYLREVLDAFSAAENFLLLINSAALAGIFALFDNTGTAGFGPWHIATVAMFFTSLVCLGCSKWSRIVHANYLSGEFYKATIRFHSGTLDAFGLFTAEYRSRGVRTLRGLWLIFSFATFGLGWVALFFLVAGNLPAEESGGLLSRPGDWPGAAFGWLTGR